MTPTSILQVALVWQGKILTYRLCGPRQTITVGPSPRATLTTPGIPGGGQRFALLVPAKPRGRYRLRLTTAFTGELTIRGQKRSVADALNTGTPSRRDAGIREVEFDPGDKARLSLSEASDLRIEVRYVEPPAAIPRPRLSRTEPFLARTTALTAMVLGMFVAAVLIFTPDDGPPKLLLTAERVAKILPPAPPPLLTPASTKKDEAKTKEESGQMKKAKDEKGKLGRHDAPAKDTVITKGDKDILRDKVSKVGLLGLIGKERQQGSGLAKLFAEERDVEQAIAGMQGAPMVAGRGSGGCPQRALASAVGERDLATFMVRETSTAGGGPRVDVGAARRCRAARNAK